MLGSKFFGIIKPKSSRYAEFVSQTRHQKYLEIVVQKDGGGGGGGGWSWEEGQKKISFFLIFF